MTYKTSATQYSLIPEVTIGVTPTASPVFQVVEHRPDSDIQSQSEWVEGDIVRANMASNGGQRVVRSASGPVNTFLKDNTTVRTMLATHLGGEWVDDELRAGGLSKSVTIEKKYGANLYRRFAGCMFNNMTIAGAFAGALTLNTNVTGLKPTNSATALTGASYPPVPFEVFRTGAVANVTLGTLTGLHYLDFSISIDAPKTPIGALGSADAVVMGEGNRKITGSIRFLIADVAGLNVSDALIPVTIVTPDFTFQMRVNCREAETGDESSVAAVTYQFDGEIISGEDTDFIVTITE